MARIIKTLIIFIFLALMAATPTRALMADVFEVNHSQAKPVRILKGEVYQQSFLSTADSFGIIAVKFSNNNKINQDLLTFRIKEENDKDWFYENQYKTDQFQNNQFFTFGFPKIDNAQGKTFVFEIESRLGLEDDSVSLFLTPNDSYQEGQLWRDNQEQEKDMVFKLIKEEPAKKLIIQDLQLKLKEDPKFFVFWLSLIFLTTLMIVFLAKNYQSEKKKL
jgi:hypothetical protein